MIFVPLVVFQSPCSVYILLILWVTFLISLLRLDFATESSNNIMFSKAKLVTWKSINTFLLLRTNLYSACFHTLYILVYT
jgi:hypothetical protein